MFVSLLLLIGCGFVSAYTPFSAEDDAVASRNRRYYSGSYYNSDSCSSWSVCSSWEHEFPFKFPIETLMSGLVMEETLAAYGELIDDAGGCLYGHTAVGAKYSKTCNVRGCGATYHTCKCVSKEEAEKAKLRKRNALKISGFVFWGIGIIVCIAFSMMIFSSERSDSLCQLGAGCSFCTLLGFILLACGYFSVDVSGYWAGCDDKGAHPQYYYAAAYLGGEDLTALQAGAQLAEDAAKAVAFASSTLASDYGTVAAYCATAISVQCIAICALATTGMDAMCNEATACAAPIQYCLGSYETSYSTITAAPTAVEAAGDEMSEQQLQDQMEAAVEAERKEEDEAQQRKSGGVVLGVTAGLCFGLPLLAWLLRKACNSDAPCHSNMRKQHHAGFDHSTYGKGRSDFGESSEI